MRQAFHNKVRYARATYSIEYPNTARHTKREAYLRPIRKPHLTISHFLNTKNNATFVPQWFSVRDEKGMPCDSATVPAAVSQDRKRSRDTLSLSPYAREDVAMLTSQKTCHANCVTACGE